MDKNIKQYQLQNQNHSMSMFLSILFSADEIWFLLQQFGTSIVFGMQNPHLGWLIDEIENADRNALKLLVDRGYVRIASKNQIELDDALAAMIRTCAHPQHTLVAQFQDSTGIDNQRYIYFGDELIVERTQTKQNQHRLTVIKDREVLLKHLREVLRLSSITTSHGKKFTLPEQTLFETRALCTQGQASKAINNLKELDLSEEISSLLTKALTNPVANSAFMALSNQSKSQSQTVKGFALLEGKNDLWIMMPYDSDGIKMVEFIPANSKLVKQRFLEILP